MVESPTATAFEITVENSDEPDAPLLSAEEKVSEKTPAIEPELLLVKTQPITTNLRGTVQHLRAKAGRFSRFRGLQIAMVLHVVHHLVFRLFTSLAPSAMLTEPLAFIAATVLLSRMKMTWTHVVISAPSTKRWWRRIPNRKMLRKIAGPTALFAIAEQMTIYLPAVLFRAYNLHKYIQSPEHFGDISDAERNAVLLQLFTVGMVGLATATLVLFPTNVSLKRVQASMLPEQDESIVPFDRTFGGKVKPEILGGSGKVGMLDAWKTFDWAARIRLVKVYAKVMVLQAAVTILFGMIVFGELKMIMGDTLDKLLMLAQARVNGDQWESVTVPNENF